MRQLKNVRGGASLCWNTLL